MDFNSLVQRDREINAHTYRFRCAECGVVKGCEGVCFDCKEAKKPSQKELEAAYNEVDRLSTYIFERFPDEPGRGGRNESAVDVAIRLMKQVRR